MLVLNKEFYTAWTEITSDRVRYWTRLWQDGFYTGSHPEWAFNPLTLCGLGRLWEVFSPRSGEPDWGKSQRYVIRVLASRRASLTDGMRFPCPTGDGEHEWDQYWATVASSNADFRTELFERLSDLVCSADTPDFEAISRLTEVLAGQLLLEGYSDYELFVRANGIIDPKGSKTMPHVDRARGLLDHLKRSPTNEFLVWTDILRKGGALSAGMSRQIAPLVLTAPETYRGSAGFARVAGAPIAISRSESTHSITAFMNHRVRVMQILRQKSTKLRLTGLTLADESSVCRLGLADRDPWLHTLPSTTAIQNAKRPIATVESEAFADAMEMVDDDPEETIRVLCDAFERQFGPHWPRSAGLRYNNRLRSSITRRLRIVIQETSDRWGNDPGAPSWLKEVDMNERLDFAQVASSIRRSARHADLLLAERFNFLSEDSPTFVTYSSITSWLYLAKGVRNREVHAGAWPLELRSIAIFLARLLLQVFVISFDSLD